MKSPSESTVYHQCCFMHSDVVVTDVFLNPNLTSSPLLHVGYNVYFTLPGTPGRLRYHNACLRSVQTVKRMPQITTTVSVSIYNQMKLLPYFNIISLRYPHIASNNTPNILSGIQCLFSTTYRTFGGSLWKSSVGANFKINSLTKKL